MRGQTPGSRCHDAMVFAFTSPHEASGLIAE
ncbi:hypothetical protein FHS38_003965 [Streptomyces netropsis]|uniref:Uncharacterized protein n=1 Tax=Streptomyces netropsis TaxID=55404 RepID=A0A7W7PFL9_STRNE|nr:hypothetical protein [Streptomyces netropsis]